MQYIAPLGFRVVDIDVSPSSSFARIFRDPLLLLVVLYAHFVFFFVRRMARSKTSKMTRSRLAEVAGIYLEVCLEKK